MLGRTSSVLRSMKLVTTTTINNANNGSNFSKIFGEASSIAPVLMNDASCALSLHSGRFAHFADSSVVCRYGNTVIHVAISCAKAENPTSDFLPLTVDYRNRMYGQGAFAPGSNRRERSTDEEVLVSRIIDRCIRPLFPKGYVNEVQVTVTAHSVDGSNTGGDPVVASIIATSHALRKSSQPWFLNPTVPALESGAEAEAAPLAVVHDGVIGCVRMGLINDELVINPTQEQMHCSDMNLLYCGTEFRPLMIEFNGNEVPEAVVSKAMAAAQNAIIPVIEYQKALRAEAEASSAVGTNRPRAGYQLSPALKAAAEEYGYARAVEIFSGRSIIPTTATAVTADGNSSSELAAVPMPARGPTRFERSRAEGMHMGSMLQWLQKEGATYAVDANNSDINCNSSNYGSIESRGEKLHPVVQGMAASHVMRKAFRSVLLANSNNGSNGGDNDNESAMAVTVRADGRQLNELRPIECYTDILPNPVHGSAVFRRGDTHVICTTTLGSKLDGKQVNPLQQPFNPGGGVDPTTGVDMSTGGDPTKRPVDNFMLHYDFPPYCTGKVGNATSLDRRMVGHGYLAEKALRGVLPPFNNFPYTVRVYAECTSSSGSSSMASVVGGCLALVDAGVPVKNLVAGASVGLVTGEEYSMYPTVETDGAPGSAGADINASVGAGLDNYTLITDILGSEDYYGDMDFKCAGTRDGLTAMQLDIKLPFGIPVPILSEALLRAREARLVIIDQMEGSLQNELSSVTLNVATSPPLSSGASTTNSSLPAENQQHGKSMASECLSNLQPVKYLRCARSMKPYAPRADVVSYSNVDKRKNIVGPAGEMKRYIQETYNVTLDIDEPGSAYIYGHSPNSNVVEASMLIKDLVTEISPNEVFHNVTVVEVKDFGLTVRLTRSQNALLHISELTHNPELLKLKALTDVFAPGQILSGSIVVLHVDNATGHVKASRKKLLLPETSASDEFTFEIPAEGYGDGHGDGSVDGHGHGGAGTGPLAGAATLDIPMTPPKKYDKGYFSSQVVSREEVERLRQQQGVEEQQQGSKSGGGKNKVQPKGSRSYSTTSRCFSSAARSSPQSTSSDSGEFGISNHGDNSGYRRVQFTSGYAEEDDDSDSPLQSINNSTSVPLPGDDTNVCISPTNDFHAIVAHRVACLVQDDLILQAEQSYLDNKANNANTSGGLRNANSDNNSAAARALDWEKRYSKRSVLLNGLHDIDSLLHASTLSSILNDNNNENKDKYHTMTAATATTESGAAESMGLMSKVKSLIDIFSSTINEVLSEKDRPAVVTPSIVSTASGYSMATSAAAATSTVSTSTDGTAAAVGLESTANAQQLQNGEMSTATATTTSATSATAISSSSSKENNDLYNIIAILQKQRSLLMDSNGQMHSTATDGHGEDSNMYGVVDSPEKDSGLSAQAVSARKRRGEQIKRDMLQLFSSYTTNSSGGAASVQDKVC